MSDTDAVVVSVDVAVDPEAAFDVFTREIDSWWKTGPRYRFIAPWNGQMRFEPGVGGRLLEVCDLATFEVGKVLIWQPGKRLVFAWVLPNFDAGQSTEVEVRFEKSSGGTRVTLEHRGWDSLPEDAPARHGRIGSDFILMIGSNWASLLDFARKYMEKQTRTAIERERKEQ